MAGLFEGGNLNNNNIFGSAIVVSVAAVGATQATFTLPAMASPFEYMSPFEIYQDSNYGFCDAKKIAHVWGQSIEEAKSTLGEKVRAGLENLADADIASTIGVVQCDWSETELTYDDAEALGQYWGRSVFEAKTKAADMMSDMGYKSFVNAMGSALVSMTGSVDDVDADPGSDAFEAFANSDFGYCDAKKIAHVWGESDVYQGKVILGNKVLGGLEHLAEMDIASTAGIVQCDWNDTQLAYEDAVQLAEYWGRTPLEAKTKAAHMMSDIGHKKFVKLMDHSLVTMGNPYDSH